MTAYSAMSCASSDGPPKESSALSLPRLGGGANVERAEYVSEATVTSSFNRCLSDGRETNSIDVHSGIGQYTRHEPP
jgi:hypothetical protein